MKTKLFLITFFAVALWAAPVSAQVDTTYFSNDAGEWSVVFDQDGKDGDLDTFSLKLSDDGEKWFFVADLDTVPGVEQYVVTGPPISTEPPQDTTGDDAPAEPQEEEESLLDRLAGAWQWIAANILLLLGIAELVVRLTPTEKDNNILRWLQSILDVILPNNKKGGGRFVAYDDVADAPALRPVFPNPEKEKAKQQIDEN